MSPSSELIHDIKNVKTENFFQDLQNFSGSASNIFNENEATGKQNIREDEKVMRQHHEENV